ncbi:hypothetical protein ABFV99_13260 [Cytobacillus horneckiae]|uniref:hypothetical protein n=1 Tax=Cytobacillus horneckiae TaxID=549687 RepID=UPI0034CEB676
MKIIGGRRGCGKTTELIKKSHENWTYIICADKNRQRYIADAAREMDLDIPHPITISELPLSSPKIGRVLVDDIEDVIGKIIGKPIELASTSFTLEAR